MESTWAEPFGTRTASLSSARDVLLEGYARYERVETKTARDGSFLLQGITTDRIRLVVSADGFATRSAELSADPGSDLQYDVELDRIEPFRIRIVDSAGEPLLGFVKFSGVSRSYELGDGGRLEVFLDDGQPRKLSFTPDGLVNGWSECTWLGWIRPGEDEIVVTVPDDALPRSSLAGTVTESDAESSRYGWAFLNQHAQTELVAGRSQISTSGDFELGPLVAGSYTLQLIPRPEHRNELPDFFLGPFRVEPGRERNLGEIRVPNPGHVRIHLSRGDGVPILDPSVFFFDSEGREIIGTYVDDNGYASAPLQPGDYELSAYVSNASWARQAFEVRSGEVTEVDLALEPAARRYIAFPVPSPAGWDEVTRAEYTIRGPSGEIYDADEFDPRRQNPRLYIPSFAVGRYTLDLTTDTDKRYRGAFQIPNLDPSHVPIKIGVSEVR